MLTNVQGCRKRSATFLPNSFCRTPFAAGWGPWPAREVTKLFDRTFSIATDREIRTFRSQAVSDPTEIPPLSRDKCSNNLWHCVSCGIAEYITATPPLLSLNMACRNPKTGLTRGASQKKTRLWSLLRYVLGRTFTRLTRVSLVTRVSRRFFWGPFWP